MLMSQTKAYDFSWEIRGNRRAHIKWDTVCMQMHPFKRKKKTRRVINYQEIFQLNYILVEYFSDSTKHSVNLKNNFKNHKLVPNYPLSVGTDHWIPAHLQSATNCGLPFAYCMRRLLIHYICFYQPISVSLLLFIWNLSCSKAAICQGAALVLGINCY